jgi:hypothetical protein
LSSHRKSRWIKRLIGAGVALILILTGCAGSSQPVRRTGTTPTAITVARATGLRALVKARFLETCLNANDQYLAMVRDFYNATTSFSAGGGSASGHALGQVVADVDTYEADLEVVRPHANADQQAQIDQYDGLLNGLRTGAQEAAGGNDQAAAQAWTGIGQQIAKLSALVGLVCNV